MAQPTPYSRSTAFADEESSNVGGRSTVRTSRVDAELDAVATTLSQILTNLAIIQRDDTKLRDGVVEMHTLSSAVLAVLTTYGSTPRGAWLTGTAYALKDIVTQSSNTYLCALAHTSGTFATDLAAGRWILLSLGTAVGAGSVTFTPTGTLAATNVQTAIEEADTEGRALSATAQSTINAFITDIATSNVATKGVDMMGFDPATAYATAGRLGQFLREPIKRTAAEVSASVTPTFYFYTPLPKYDLRRCGVVMDGVTDDTAAVNRVLSVIAQQGGGNVLQGPATIRITAALASGVLPENLTWDGVGKEVSKIKIDAADVAFKRIYSSHTNVNRLNLLLRNLQITGAATALGGVNLEMADYAYFEHVQFENFQAVGAYGARMAQCYRSGFDYCHWEDIKTYGLLQLALSGVGCNHTWVHKSEVIGNNQPAFIGLSLNGQNIIIEDNDISGSGNGLHGISAENTDGLHIKKNYIEQWTGNAIRATTGSPNTGMRIVGRVCQSLGTYVIDLDHASVNDDVRVDDVRFADITGGQTGVRFGSTTNWGGGDNDPASGAESDKGPLGRKTQALYYTNTWNPPSIAGGAYTSTEFTVTGAAVGDRVIATLDNLSTNDMTVDAHVRAAGIVRVLLTNKEAGAIDLGSTNIRITVLRGPN